MCRVFEDNYNYTITQKYKLTHKALDMVGNPKKIVNVVAHSDGVVTWVQKGKKNNKLAVGNASYGNAVKIKHNDGFYTLYAHMKDNIKVKKGDKVKKGQFLGTLSDSGRAWGAHLHWELRNTKDNKINPTPYLNKDLPTYFQVYDNKKNKWLPKIELGSSDYAGNLGNAISGVRIDNLKYKVHDKVKKKWLPIVNGSSSYAGNLPNDIDAIAIKTDSYIYQVHEKGGKWLSFVDGFDVKDSINGYAGNLGHSIDGLRIIHK